MFLKIGLKSGLLMMITTKRGFSTDLEFTKSGSVSLVRVDRLDALALPPIDYIKSVWMVLTRLLSEKDLNSVARA